MADNTSDALLMQRKSQMFHVIKCYVIFCFTVRLHKQFELSESSLVICNPLSIITVTRIQGVKINFTRIAPSDYFGTTVLNTIIIQNSNGPSFFFSKSITIHDTAISNSAREFLLYLGHMP